MPCLLIIGAIIGLLAMRYPIINRLVGWAIGFSIVAVSAGSIAWALLMQRWNGLFSFRGYGAVLAVCSLLVAVWVARLNRS